MSEINNMSDYEIIIEEMKEETKKPQSDAVKRAKSKYYNKKKGKEKKHGSWANLKGGGQLAAKAGNGAQMRGMVPGLGSVSGCPTAPRQRRRGAYGHKCMQVS